jgi:seryl-tRNA synthetase
MLDARFIRENIDAVKKNTEERNMDASVIDSWVKVDQTRKQLTQQIEEIRRQKNTGSKDMDEAARAAIAARKKELAECEARLKTVETEWYDYLSQIPNMHDSDVPVGKTDEENVVTFQSAELTKFDFTPKNHLDLTVARKLIDFERGAKVAGSQFYYLQGDMVLLEMAVVQFVLDIAVKHGYYPLHTPDLARSRFYLGTGYNPRGDEAQTYEIAGEDLGLIATSEVTTAGYHADETLDIAEMPIKYISFSHCFRKEAGAYGKYSKGLYRIHQFTKLEMFAYSTPEQSEALHQEILGIEEEILQQLGIPYRILDICTGDLGAMAAKKYDLEAWMPGRGDFGEVTSASNCTDYQSRNLNIRYRDKQNKVQYAHMLNGTASALSRTLIAIIENYQQADGSIAVPPVLQKYMLGGKTVI